MDQSLTEQQLLEAIKAVWNAPVCLPAYRVMRVQGHTVLVPL